MKKIIAKILLFLMFFNIFNVNISANTEGEKDNLPGNIEILENNSMVYFNRMDKKYYNYDGTNHNQTEKPDLFNLGTLQTKNVKGEILENIKYTILGNQNVKLDENNNILFDDKEFSNERYFGWRGGISDENTFVVLADNGNNGKYITHFLIKKYSSYDKFYKDYYKIVKSANQDGDYVAFTPKFYPKISSERTIQVTAGENFDFYSGEIKLETKKVTINGRDGNGMIIEEERENDINVWEHINFKDLQKDYISITNNDKLGIEQDFSEIIFNENNISFKYAGKYKMYVNFNRLINARIHTYNDYSGFGYGHKIENGQINFSVNPKIKLNDKICHSEMDNENGYLIGSVEGLNDELHILKTDLPENEHKIVGNKIYKTTGNKIENFKILVFNKYIIIPEVSVPVFDYNGALIGYETINEETKFEMENLFYEKNINYNFEICKIPANLTVKYIDTENNKIADDLIEEKNVGDKYETKAKNIEGYELRGIPLNAEGIIDVGGNTVTYLYEKIVEKPAPIEKANLIVKYIDTENNKISDDLIEEKNVGENYITNAKNIEGYNLKTTPENANGNIKIGDNIVTYIYEKIKPTPIEEGEVEIKFVTIDNNVELAEPLFIHKNIGSDYETFPKSIVNYDLVSNSKNTFGKITKEKITVFYYYKRKTNVEGTPPIIPEITDDPRVNIPKTPETKPEIPEAPVKIEDPIIPKFKNKKRVYLKSFEENIIGPKKSITVIKKLPNKLPKTGALDSNDLFKKGGLAGSEFRENIDIRLPKKETFKLAGSQNTDLKYWLQVVPEIDREKDQYIVLPTQGLVMPFNSVSENDKAFQKFTSGENEDFYSYLRDGAVEIPSSPNNFGEIGNKVIAGHSSYWYDGKSRYKTHFQKIIGMETDEEIWIYKKNSSGEFERFVYKVEKSYNTDDEDTSVLNPTDDSTLTLFTCTPIGGSAGRWIVKAKFVK